MLTQFYPPFLGGEERHVQTLSRELSARGHDVAVATLGGPDLPDHEMDGGVHVHRMESTIARLPGLTADPSRYHAPPIPDPGLVSALRRLVQEYRPDIVHAHNWLVYSFLPLKIWSNARLVLSLHDYSVSSPTKKLMYKDAVLCTGPALGKCLGCATYHYGLKGAPIVLAHRGMAPILRRLVDLFLPVSTATAEGNGLPAMNVPFEVIPNFVPDTVADSRADLDEYVRQLPPSGYFLFAGAFAGYKGVDILLEAYRTLSGVPPLVLIGYDTAEDPMRTRDIPQNVTILKNWPHGAVMEAWRRCSIGVIPSTCAEAFPTVAIEAMVTGRPVVASRIGGLVDAVADGVTGILVPPGDPVALGAALTSLAQDTELWARMSAASRERSSLFTTSAVIPQIEDAYARLLDPGRPDVPRSDSVPDSAPV